MNLLELEHAARERLQQMREAAENTLELIGIERGITYKGPDLIGGWAKVYRRGWSVPAYDEVSLEDKTWWTPRALQDEAERRALTMAFPVVFHDTSVPALAPELPPVATLPKLFPPERPAGPSDVPGGDPENPKAPAPEEDRRLVIAQGIARLHAGFAKPPSEATKLKVRMHFCGTPDVLEAKITDLGAESLLWQALADQKHQKYQRAFELCQAIIKNTAKKGASI